MKTQDKTQQAGRNLLIAEETRSSSKNASSPRAILKAQCTRSGLSRSIKIKKSVYDNIFIDKNYNKNIIIAKYAKLARKESLSWENKIIYLWNLRFIHILFIIYCSYSKNGRRMKEHKKGGVSVTAVVPAGAASQDFWVHPMASTEVYWNISPGHVSPLITASMYTECQSRRPHDLYPVMMDLSCYSLLTPPFSLWT